MVFPHNLGVVMILAYFERERIAYLRAAQVCCLVPPLPSLCAAISAQFRFFADGKKIHFAVSQLATLW